MERPIPLGILGFGIGFYLGTILFRVASPFVTILIWTVFGFAGSLLALISINKGIVSYLQVDWRSNRLNRILADPLHSVLTKRRVDGHFVVYTFNPIYKRWVRITLVLFILGLFISLPAAVFAVVSIVIYVTSILASRRMFSDRLRARSKRIVQLEGGYREIWYEI
jgi:hypothetical protein